MGVWDTALFSNDLACDIRDHYRELIEDGVDDTEATRQTTEKYRASFDDPEDGASAILALAVTQSKIGRLDPVIRDLALAALERGGDLAVWAIDNPKLLAKRKQVLSKAGSKSQDPSLPARVSSGPPGRVAVSSQEMCSHSISPAALRYCESFGFMSTGGVKLPALRNCSSAELTCQPLEWLKS